MLAVSIPKRLFTTTWKLRDGPVDAALRRSILKRKQASGGTSSSGEGLFTQRIIPYVAKSQSKSFQRNLVGLVAGAGLGTVCVYGALQKSTSAESTVWPDFVRSRLRKTFVYLGASIGITAATAVATFRSPVMMKMLLGSGRRPMLTLLASYAAVMGTGIMLHTVPYGHPAKHVCWLLHTGTLGILVSPLLVLGGPLIMQAAWYTAGITGCLALVSTCAPSHQFLNWSGPLSIGLGAVVLASIGSVFAGPPIGLLSSGLYSLSTYGGLVVFSGLLLYDTQKIAKKAESLPPQMQFDPINESTSVFLDVLNIFTRIVMILAGNNGGKSGGGNRLQGRVNPGLGGGSRRR